MDISVRKHRIPAATGALPVSLLLVLVLTLFGCVGTVYAEEQGTDSETPPATETVASKDTDTIPEEWFDTALFFGDSITGGLGHYTMYSGGLGKAQFVYKNGMACHHLTRDKDTVPYTGKARTLAEIAELSGADRLFLLMAMNDLGIPLDDMAESWKTVIQSVRERCPGISIYIQSGTPVHQDIGRFTKKNILEYNEFLKDLCEELDCVYVDITAGLSDETGYMPVSLMNNNEHFNNQGYAIWAGNLRNVNSYSVRPEF